MFCVRTSCIAHFVDFFDAIFSDFSRLTQSMIVQNAFYNLGEGSYGGYICQNVA